MIQLTGLTKDFGRTRAVDDVTCTVEPGVVTGFNVAVPIRGKHSLAASYSYSTESDYWSHQAGLRASFSLFQDNTALMLGGDYGHNTVGKRLGPTGYLLMGVMQSAHVVALWTQVLTRRILMTTSYEASVLVGYQNNPYRPAFVAGPGGLERRETENLPNLRVRHVVALSWHILFPTERSVTPHVTLRPAIRGHFDSWGLKAFSPELATSVPVGPTEFRLLLSFYDQYAASFYRADGGGRAGYVADTPSYGEGPVEWGTRMALSLTFMPGRVDAGRPDTVAAMVRDLLMPGITAELHSNPTTNRIQPASPRKAPA